MIDGMFWPFSNKAVAERLNSLQVYLTGHMSESILHDVEIEDILVKYYHNLLCPTYVLDARLQISGGAGPPKWEPHSRIGVYLGHSPFHLGKVDLVWNPTTGRVRPQYYVVFDDDFTTMPYMEAGTLTPNWKELIEHSSEKATTKNVFKADTWLSDQQIVDATDHLTDMFAIVPDQSKKQRPQCRAAN